VDVCGDGVANGWNCDGVVIANGVILTPAPADLLAAAATDVDEAIPTPVPRPPLPAAAIELNSISFFAISARSSDMESNNDATGLDGGDDTEPDALSADATAVARVGERATLGGGMRDM